jgi:ATP-binding cassette subfamily B protein
MSGYSQAHRETASRSNTLIRDMKRNFLFRYLARNHWKALTVAFIAVVMEGLADVAQPWPIKVVLDYVIGHKRPPGWLDRLIHSTFGDSKQSILLTAVAIVLAAAVIGAIASYVGDVLTTKVGQAMMRDLRLTLYHHLQRLSLSVYHRNRIGDMIGRVTADVDAIQDFVSSALMGIVVDVLTLAGMIGLMFYLNWRFTLIALLVAPFLFVQVYVTTRRIKKTAREARRKESEIVSVIEETLSSIRVVKAFAREDYEEARLDREERASIKIALRASRMKAMLGPMVDIIVAIGTAIVLWAGAKMVLAGQLTPGALIVFLLYLGKMYKPMRDLSKLSDTVSKAAVGAERIKEVIRWEAETRDLPRARPAPRFKGEIAFEGVSFSYVPGQPVLKDVSLSIQRGQFAAIVGPTGAGKSTIASLIPRFYHPQAGQVKIDGTDVRMFTIRTLRERIGFVMQESLLFHGSVWQNIAYGRPNATRAEVFRAAKLANAHEFIVSMPQGYDTVIGERGDTLSGGQRQRIAIARAIIRDAPILILDEPSSGLDAAAEEVVFEALQRLMEGRTSIVIAHRLATIRSADVIFAVQDGSIVERGRHEELLALGGLYAQLHQIQFGDVLPEPRAPLDGKTRPLSELLRGRLTPSFLFNRRPAQ